MNFAGQALDIPQIPGFKFRAEIINGNRPLIRQSIIQQSVRFLTSSRRICVSAKGSHSAFPGGIVIIWFSPPQTCRRFGILALIPIAPERLAALHQRDCVFFTDGFQRFFVFLNRIALMDSQRKHKHKSDQKQACQRA